MILCYIMSTLPNFKAPSFKKKTSHWLYWVFTNVPLLIVVFTTVCSVKTKIIKFVLIYACCHLIPITLNTCIVFHTSLFTDNTYTLNTCIDTVSTGWVTQTPSCRFTVFIRGTGTTFSTPTSIVSRWTGPWAVLTYVTRITRYNYVLC